MKTIEWISIGICPPFPACRMRQDLELDLMSIEMHVAELCGHKVDTIRKEQCWFQEWVFYLQNF